MNSPEYPSSIERYFTEFLAGKLHQPLLPKLQKLSVVFAIQLTGRKPQTWTLTIKNGVLSAISAGAAQPECSFSLDAETFAAIIAGQLAPQMAFFKRQVEIFGAIETGLRLAFVLGDFFKAHPYTVDRVERAP